MSSAENFTQSAKRHEFSGPFGLLSKRIASKIEFLSKDC